MAPRWRCSVQEAALPVAGDLPAEVVVLVLRHLDHDSLFTALATCRWGLHGHWLFLKQTVQLDA